MNTVNRHTEAPRRKSTLHVLKTHGKKFKYTVWHCGGANMFGGYNWSKANTYIRDAEYILDSIKSEIYDVTFESEDIKQRFNNAVNLNLSDEVKPRL